MHWKLVLVVLCLATVNAKPRHKSNHKTLLHEAHHFHNHTRQLEEVIDHVHKGEYEQVTDLFMAIPKLSSNLPTKCLPLMQSLIIAGLLANVETHVVTNGFKFTGTKSFTEALLNVVANGLNAKKGQRIYELDNNRGAVLNRDLSDNERVILARRHSKLHGLTEVTTLASWMRDFGPLFTCAATDNHREISSFFSGADHSFAGRFANVFPSNNLAQTPHHRLSITIPRGNPGAGTHPIKADGGNLQSNGRCCVISEDMVNKNLHGHDKHTIETLIGVEFEKRLGCVNTIVVQNLAMELTMHVDMYIHWTGPTNIVIGKTRQEQDRANKNILDENTEQIQNQISGLTVTRMIMPSRCPQNELIQYYASLVLAGPDGSVNIREGSPFGAEGWSSYIMIFGGMKHLTIEQQKELIRYQANRGLLSGWGFNKLLEKMAPDYGVRWACPELDSEYYGVEGVTEYHQMTFRSYVNALMLNGIVVMPTYQELFKHKPGHKKDKQDDEVHLHKRDQMAAIKAWLQQPGVTKVITGASDKQISMGGSAHCTTQTARAC